MENQTVLSHESTQAAQQDTIVTIASAELGRSDTGYRPDLTMPQGSVARNSTVVSDIGTLMAKSLFQAMSNTTVNVPSYLAYAFHAAQGTGQLGSLNGPSAQKIRSLVVLEAFRASILDGTALASSGGSIAALSTSLGLDPGEMEAMVSAVSNRLSTLLIDRQAAMVLTGSSAAETVDIYATLFNPPTITHATALQAHFALSNLYSQLSAGVDLTALSLEAKKLDSTIPGLSEIRDLVTIRSFSALPTTPMAASALFSLIESGTDNGSSSSGPSPLLSLPAIRRVTEGDLDGSIGQLKFWTLEAPDFYNKVFMNDVIATVTQIDRSLFGLSASAIPIETYMNFVLASGSRGFLPQLPAPGTSLTDTPMYEGMLSYAAFVNALKDPNTPQEALFSALLGQAKDRDITSIKPALMLRIQALIAIADTLPQVRRVFSDIIEAGANLSMRCGPIPTDEMFYGAISTKNIGGYDYALIAPVDAAPLLEELEMDRDAIANEDAPKKKRGARGASALAISGSTSASGGSGSVLFGRIAGAEADDDSHLLVRSAFERWKAAYAECLSPMISSSSVSATARAVADPALLLSRPPLFNFSQSVRYVLSPRPWYTRVERPNGTFGISAFDLPLPRTFGNRLMFASRSSGVSIGDGQAGALFPIIANGNLRHDVLPFFTIENSGAMALAPFDISGLINAIPVQVVEALVKASGTSPVANVASALITAWNKGFVSLSISRIQTALLLRTADAIKVQSTADLIQNWPALYRTLNVTDPALITQVDRLAALRSDYAVQVGPEPIIFLPTVASMFVERTELGPASFSLCAPLLSLHDYAHASLSILSGDQLISPPAVASLSTEKAGPLILNEAATSAISYDAKPRRGNQDGPISSNVGVQLQRDSNGRSEAASIGQDDVPLSPDNSPV